MFSEDELSLLIFSLQSFNKILSKQLNKNDKLCKDYNALISKLTKQGKKPELDIVDCALLTVALNDLVGNNGSIDAETKNKLCQLRDKIHILWDSLVFGRGQS